MSTDQTDPRITTQPPCAKLAASGGFLVGFFFLFFLDAPSHLYMRSCPSVRPSVRRSIRRSVPCYFRRHTRRILCRVSGLVSSLHQMSNDEKVASRKQGWYSSFFNLLVQLWPILSARRFFPIFNFEKCSLNYPAFSISSVDAFTKANILGKTIPAFPVL